MSRFWNPVLGKPWLTTHAALSEIKMRAEQSDMVSGALSKEFGEWLEGSYDVEVRSRIAIITATGLMFRLRSFMQWMMRGSSYSVLAKDFETARQNQEVDAIVLVIDTPGGDAHGISELSDMIYAARGEKPIIAFIAGDGFSAGYWLASAADEVVIADTGMAGSVGVVLSIAKKGAEDPEGGEVYEIVSEQSPNKLLDPGSEKGQKRFQRIANSIARVFIEKVARNRSMDAQAVIDDFDKGGMFVGQEAVDAGLADRVGTFEDIISSLEKRFSSTPASSGHHIATLESIDMKTKQTQNAEEASQADTPTVHTSETLQAAQPELVSQLSASGASSERERINGILTLEAATGRESLAKKLAFTEGMTAEVATGLLESAPQASASAGTGFEAAMASELNPELSDDTDDSLSDEDKLVAEVVAAGEMTGIA